MQYSFDISIDLVNDLVHQWSIFTKRADVLLQDLAKFRSREIRV